MSPIDKNSPIPFYQQLANILRGQILSGALKPGDALPTEFTLAEVFHISRSSVRQAIDLLVSVKLVRRVQGKGNFVSDLKSNGDKGGMIGFLVPDARLYLYMNMLSGVEAGAKARGFSVVYSYMGGSELEELATYQRLRDQNVSGLVIYPPNDITYDAAIWQIAADGFPFILIDHYFESLPSAFVGVDNVKAAYEAVNHLINLGHSTIGFASSDEMHTSTIRDRFVGYRKALQEHQLAFHTDWVLLAPIPRPQPLYLEEEEQVQVNFFRQRLSERPLPTAIFAINDMMAYEVYKAAKLEGIRVPDDLSLVGFDDDDYGKRTDPPLTTVAQPYRELGARAAHMLIDRINGLVNAGEHVLLPTKLVVRHSSGKPAQVEIPV
jgi:GntR family transcriptional regulator of arabinose operon